ncbi:hypothetical protein L4174_006030 [Photobacterium sp. CCB-ST2H9]|uniref:hypothetical protein n=1 Tax=unclassified Photobacterium TaxID=2628852 RepID=UPI002006CFFF|nr:hypothetical protein [Photobacterium sp. CCB-ST2H9]UTM58393.1 hypothetical protein L4174_006030 [Photobacterium sp. CCB-ST2H9]
MNTYFVMKKGLQYSAREKVSPDELKGQYEACREAGMFLAADSVLAASEEDAIRHVKTLTNQTLVAASIGCLNAFSMLVVDSPVNLALMLIVFGYLFVASKKTKAFESEDLKALRKIAR